MRISLRVAATTALPALFACAALSCTASFTEPSSSADAPDPNAILPVVEAVQSRQGTLPLSERLNGTVIAHNQVELYPEISGTVDKVLARDGDLVKRGDPLVVLQDQQFQEQLQQSRAAMQVSQAAVKQAEARYREIEAEYRRTRMLAGEGLASQFEVETLQAQLESAEAAIELAQAQLRQAASAIAEREEILSRTIVRAPITGVVGQRNAEVGMQVGPGTRLFTIGDLDRVRVRVALTEKMLEQIRAGQPVRLLVGGQGESRPVTATLSRISPFLDPLTRTAEAEIDVANPANRLRPGMYVAVDILHGRSRNAVLVPTSALFTHPQTRRQGVYVVGADEGLLAPPQPGEDASRQPLSSPVPVEFHPVEVVAEGRMELGVQGIEAGRWVVAIGQDLLSEGRGQARVRPADWDRILHLQGLQRQDLLYQVLQRADE